MAPQRLKAVEVGFASRQGPHRDENQDSFGIFPRASGDGTATPRLFVVADGMGGHRGGREASQMAVLHVEEQVIGEATRDPFEALERGVKAANRAIFERAAREPTLDGMGTTCTALLLKDRAAYVAHVGDSRAYRMRGDAVEQLTTDHSWVEHMVRDNQMSREDALHHDQRHVLHRAVGVVDEVDVDRVGPERLQDGDSFVLCSDGVDMIASERLLAAVRHGSPQDACDTIVQWVADAGGQDDATVVVVTVRL